MMFAYVLLSKHMNIGVTGIDDVNGSDAAIKAREFSVFLVMIENAIKRRLSRSWKGRVTPVFSDLSP